MDVNMSETLKNNIRVETAIINIVIAAFTKSRLQPINLDTDLFIELIDGLGGNKTITGTHIKAVLSWLYTEGYFTSSAPQNPYPHNGFFTGCVPTSKLIMVCVPRIEYVNAELDL